MCSPVLEAASDKLFFRSVLANTPGLQEAAYQGRLPSLASVNYRFSRNLKLTFKMGTVFICFRWGWNCRTAFWTYSSEFWTRVIKVSLQKASLISGATLCHCEQWNGWCLLLVWRRTVSALRIIPIQSMATDGTSDLKVQKTQKRAKPWFCLITENFTIIFKGSAVSPAYFHWEYQITIKQMQHMRNRGVCYKTDYYLQWQRVFPQLEACSQHLLILHNLRVLYPWWRHRVSLDHACIQHQSQNHFTV